MARRRFFVDELRHGRACLTGEDARHLRQVLRAEPGQKYEICDNSSVWLAEVEASREGEVVFRALDEVPPTLPPVRVTVLAALTKFDRFEWTLEKATELGVEAFIPVEAARSEVGLAQAALKRMERWRRIVRQSSQQARRSRMPEIAAPMRFECAVAMAAPLRYSLDETGGIPLLSAVPAVRNPEDRVLLLTGPEGGWTAGERRTACESGWTPISLGPLILRVETAVLASVAVLVNAWMTGPSVDSAVWRPLS